MDINQRMLRLGLQVPDIFEQTLTLLGKCIHGEPTFKEVQADDNLGKSVRFGMRNVPHSGDEDRVFGVPTIRSDIKKPRQKSVADIFNYGDEPEAVALLFPERFHELGVSTKEFEAFRPKEEVKTCDNIDYLSFWFS